MASDVSTCSSRLDQKEFKLTLLRLVSHSFRQVEEHCVSCLGKILCWASVS